MSNNLHLERVKTALPKKLDQLLQNPEAKSLSNIDQIFETLLSSNLFELSIGH